MVFFASSPGASLISISTFSAVKSSMDLMRIFFLRAASSMEAMSESVVVPGGQFADDERAGDVRLRLDDRAQLDLARALGVAAGVHDAALREIGQQRERFALEDGDLRLDQLAEIVRQHARAQAHGDAFRAEHQQQRQLGGQRDGFLVAPVVAGDRLGELVVENLVAREVGQAALDVARGRRRVAGVDVAEVPLPLDEVTLLLQHDERVGDGGVAVRMELHAVADDVGDLDELAVVVAVERVQDAPLHGLEAVFQRGDGAVADDVARVRQEIAVHQRPERRIVRRRGCARGSPSGGRAGAVLPPSNSGSGASSGAGTASAAIRAVGGQRVALLVGRGRCR